MKHRNSNVELVRILAIVLILLNHVLQNDMQVDSGTAVAFSASLLARLGGVGDVMFFGITAWFLADRESSLRTSLKRIWILDRQVLFYAIGLFAIVCTLRATGHGFATASDDSLRLLAWQSLFPLATHLWWYPSGYAIFLLVQPWLNQLLHRMGSRAHICLAAVLFALFSIQAPGGVTYLGWSPQLFVYQYIVIAAIRWYVSVESIPCGALALVGALSGLSGPLLYGLLGSDDALAWLNAPQALPSMCIGIAVVVAAVRAKPRTSRLVNRLAACTFAAYLILCYPPVQNILLYKALGLFWGSAGLIGWTRLLAEVALALAFLGTAVATDTVRQLLFAATFDRNKGGLFDRAWSACVKRIPLIERVQRTSRCAG